MYVCWFVFNHLFSPPFIFKNKLHLLLLSINKLLMSNDRLSQWLSLLFNSAIMICLFRLKCTKTMKRLPNFLENLVSLLGFSPFVDIRPLFWYFGTQFVKSSLKVSKSLKSFCRGSVLLSDFWLEIVLLKGLCLQFAKENLATVLKAALYLAYDFVSELFLMPAMDLPLPRSSVICLRYLLICIIKLISVS